MDGDSAIAALAAAIDTVAAVEVDELSAVDKHRFLRDLNRQLRRLDCARHVATAAFETSGELLEVGYRTLAQWHHDQLHCSTHEAGRVGALSRSLVHMPTVLKRWAAGDLDAEQARAISWLRNDRTEDAFAEWEPWLADQPIDHDHRELRIVLRRWKLAADPDGPDPDGGEADVKVTTSLGGTVRADVLLEPVMGAAFKDLFDDIVDELFQADWAAAKDQLDGEPTLSDLTRDAKQRRHDAFAEIVRRARATGDAERHDPRPLVTVVTGLAALAAGLAQLWDGTPLSPAELAEVLDTDPEIQRFVYGADEAPLSYNRRARLYTGKLREAILTRDRRCTGRGCEADTRRGAVDHIHAVAAGGQTTPDNGRGACHPCNRSRPRRRFRNDPDPP